MHGYRVSQFRFLLYISKHFLASCRSGDAAPAPICTFLSTQATQHNTQAFRSCWPEVLLSCGTLRARIVIGHVQELGVDVSGTLPLGVEDELVVAPVRTDCYDGVCFGAKGTNAMCPSWDLELAEAHLRVEVLWEEGC